MMRRIACVALLLQLGATVEAHAQSRPVDEAWHQHFEQARRAFIAQRYAEAAAQFQVLAHSARNTTDANVAGELGAIAAASVVMRDPRLQLRTSDELAVLYTTAVFYALGTGGWLALQLQPKSFGAALLPFAVLTPAAVGAVALVDAHFPLRRGIPHAIAAGLYLGFGEGLWIVAYQNARAQRTAIKASWHAERVATALWVGATAGAWLGGLIGASFKPTPGRVAFTASAAIWSGVLGAFAGSAFAHHRADVTYLAGGVGYNIGLLAGSAFGPSVAPSVTRVRALDFGGLVGTLLAGGATALFTDELGSRETFGMAAVGGAAGLALAWIATADMAPDTTNRASTIAPRYSVTPMRGGWFATVNGEL